MNNNIKQSLPGHAAMFLCNVLWGMMSPISKDALNYFATHDISPVILPSLRMLGAGVCFWILSLFTPHEHVPRADKMRLFLAGLLSVALNQNLFVCGVAFTSPIDASVITTLLPIATMLLAAVVLREPISHLKAGGVLVGMTGAVLLILSGGVGLSLDHQHALGDIMCMTAQVSFACYLVFFRDIMGRYNPVTLMKWMFLSASIVVLPFTGPTIYRVDFAAMPTPILLDIAYVVFVATFVTFLLVPIGQKRLRPTVVSAYNYVQPVVATVLSLIIGVATFGWVKALAVALVFTGVIMVTRSKARQNS